MKKCKHCGVEMPDEQLFCPQCGAEQETTKKKFSYYERKEAKERERLELISKASIQSGQLDAAQQWTTDDLYVEQGVLANNMKRRCIVRLVIEVVVGVLCIVWGEFATRNATLDNNWKLLILLVAFVVCACCLAGIVSDGNYLRVITKMMKSRIAIKKIKYGQDPTAYFDGFMYTISTKGKCKQCESKTHIEEVDGQFVVVCDFSRNHIYKIDSKELCEKIEKTSKK